MGIIGVLSILILSLKVCTPCYSVYVYLNDVHRWLNGHAGVLERVFFYLHKFRMIDATCTKLNGEQLVTAFILRLS